MEKLILPFKDVLEIGRWDIDFHLPPKEILAFPQDTVCRVDTCADIVKTKRDPSLKPSETFQYIDISSVDVKTGEITQAQELTGEEAPSRARKVVKAYDIIISTCRPTRGALAVIPEALHGQICSTGFSVIRAKRGVNPFYLHFALRLSSTLEQFRKWSTGSSYPAILDDDVEKTLIPVPPIEDQDCISKLAIEALQTRQKVILEANKEWEASTSHLRSFLEGKSAKLSEENYNETEPDAFSTSQLLKRLEALPEIPEEQVLQKDLLPNPTKGAKKTRDFSNEFYA